MMMMIFTFFCDTLVLKVRKNTGSLTSTSSRLGRPYKDIQSIETYLEKTESHGVLRTDKTYTQNNIQSIKLNAIQV